jgi:endonuclease-3 related protein
VQTSIFMLAEIYSCLMRTYGPQGWWPARGDFSPPEWEVELGSLLTQNTAWRNVEKALGNLLAAGVTTRQKLLSLPEERLASLIRPSGYYRQKARKLRELASLEAEPTRENLLSVWGIGKETADSILLYAYGKPFFVVDAYTRRIFSRLGLIKGSQEYDEIRSFFEKNLPRDVPLYKEFHALIVRLGKEHCRARPVCRGCPLEDTCPRQEPRPYTSKSPRRLPATETSLRPHGRWI